MKAGLINVLLETFGVAVSPEDLLTYAYGLLASPYNDETFSEALKRVLEGAFVLLLFVEALENSLF